MPNLAQIGLESLQMLPVSQRVGDAYGFSLTDRSRCRRLRCVTRAKWRCLVQPWRDLCQLMNRPTL